MVLMTDIILALAFIASAVALNETLQNATIFALQYGYPLLAFERFLRVNMTTNEFYHPRKRTDRSFGDVMRQDGSMLISTAIVDLSQGLYLLALPRNFPQDQIAFLSFYDIYGENLGDIGPAPSIRSEYGDSWTTDTSISQLTGANILYPPAKPFLDADEEASGVYLAGGIDSQIDVGFPGFYGIIMIRWLMDRDQSNLEQIYALQDEVYLEPWTSQLPQEYNPTAPSLQDAMRQANFSEEATPAENVMRLVAALAPWNGPKEPAARNQTRQRLTLARAYDGSWTPYTTDDVDLDLANQTAVSHALLASVDSFDIRDMNNGWTIPREGLQARFEESQYNSTTSIAHRTAASLSKNNYFQMQAPLVVYPTWTNNNQNASLITPQSWNLKVTEALTFSFSGRPWLLDKGFWTLTSYAEYGLPGEASIGSANRPLSRGTLMNVESRPVYESEINEDLPFTILVQYDPPTEEWIGNWLPTGRDQETTVILRWYVPGNATINGTYEYPVVERREAIVPDSVRRNEGGLVSRSLALTLTMLLGWALWFLP